MLDLEQIDEPDGSYDVVLCREGLMLVPDPARAAREIERVLRPGGRVALAVWGPRERNPWLGVVFDTVSAQLGTPVPPPGVPGPFSLEDRRRARRAARRRRALPTSRSASCRRRTAPARSRSGGRGRPRSRARSRERLAALPEPAARALLARARAAVGAYETPAGLEIPGLALVADAVRP